MIRWDSKVMSCGQKPSATESATTDATLQLGPSTGLVQLVLQKRKALVIEIVPDAHLKRYALRARVRTPTAETVAALGSSLISEHRVASFRSN